MILLNNMKFQHCFYTKYGEGYPIILLHGFGETSEIFEYQIEYLKKYYTIIVPEVPGTPHSQLPEETMTMELIADFVLEILKQEKIEKTILLGHSMGGYATLAFAEKYEKYLDAFGLIHSTAFADSDEKKENRKKSIRLIQNEGKDIFLKTMTSNLYSEKSRNLIPDLIEKHTHAALSIPAENLIAYYNAMIERPDRTHVLKSTNLSVLLVAGKEDNLIPFQDIITQATFPRMSKLSLFNEIGHTSMYENPQILNENLKNFCKEVLELKKL